MQTLEQYDYIIAVTLKTFRGTSAPTYERHEFRFCAASRNEARVLALSNVKSKGFPHDEKQIQILNAIPAGNPIPSDECYFGDHDICGLRWCECVCHARIVFPLESAPLMSCTEVESQREEEAA